MSTTAKIAAKGCNGTGITDDIAEALRLGQTLVVVAELVVEAHHEKRNGDEAVVLNILTVEPATKDFVEDYLRNMQRALHYERKLIEDGPQMKLPGDHDDPSVDDVIAQGKGVLAEPDNPDGQPRLIDPDLDDDPADDPADDREPDPVSA
jgi:hypothetical protein